MTNIGFLLVGTQNEHRRRGSNAINLPRDVSPAEIRKPHFCHDHINLYGFNKMQGFAPAPHFSNDLDARRLLEKLMRSKPSYGLVVCNDDASR